MWLKIKNSLYNAKSRNVSSINIHGISNKNINDYRITINVVLEKTLAQNPIMVLGKTFMIMVENLLMVIVQPYMLKVQSKAPKS